MKQITDSDLFHRYCDCYADTAHTNVIPAMTEEGFLIAMEEYRSLPPVDGMRWVKASERLPERSEWPDLHYRLDGYKADGILMCNEAAGIIWFEYKHSSTYTDLEDLSRVEWLEESQDDEVNDGQNKRNAALDYAKGYAAAIEKYREQKVETSHTENSLLASFISIADRKGEKTNWEAFKNQCLLVLKKTANPTLPPVDVRAVAEKAKRELIWEMIEDWQMSKDSDTDIEEPLFSYQDIECDLYRWLEKIEPKSTLPPSPEDLQKELAVTDFLMNDYKRVLDAIPECPAHGSCIPHALEWIEKAKAIMESNTK